MRAFGVLFDLLALLLICDSIGRERLRATEVSDGSGNGVLGGSRRALGYGGDAFAERRAQLCFRSSRGLAG